MNNFDIGLSVCVSGPWGSRPPVRSTPSSGMQPAVGSKESGGGGREVPDHDIVT